VYVVAIESTLESTHSWASGVVTPDQLASFDSGILTTASNGDILIGIGTTDMPHTASGAGFTSRYAAPATPYVVVEDQVGVSAGSYAAPFVTDTTGYPNNPQFFGAAAVAAFH
jgi:hypothetical protein